MCSSDLGVISSDMSGDISNLYGVISSNLYGVISSNLSGVISSRLYGDITGISGSATGCIGNLDDYELTDKERENGVDINDLTK